MIGIRRHDGYVLRAFWGAFAVALLFFTVIVVVAHVADRAVRFVRYFGPLREMGYDPWVVIVEYYATLLPFMWLHLVPLATIIGAGFALTRLTRHNEVAPLVTGGVSTRRVLLPVVLSGVFVSGLLFAMQEVLLPSINRRNSNLSRLLNDAQPDRVTKVPHILDPGRSTVHPRTQARVSMEAFRPLQESMEGALLTVRVEGRSPHELHWYPLLTWEPDTLRWVAPEGGRLFPLVGDPKSNPHPPIAKGSVAPISADLLLVEVHILKDASIGMSAREVARLLEADPENPRLILLYHSKYASALSPLVLLLLGLPFMLRLGRGSALPGVISVLIGGSLYYTAMFMSSSLAASGELNPVVLAWLPTVVLGSIGAALYVSMQS